MTDDPRIEAAARAICAARAENPDVLEPPRWTDYADLARAALAAADQARPIDAAILEWRDARQVMIDHRGAGFWDDLSAEVKRLGAAERRLMELARALPPPPQRG